LTLVTRHHYLFLASRAALAHRPPLLGGQRLAEAGEGEGGVGGGEGGGGPEGQAVGEEAGGEGLKYRRRRTVIRRCDLFL
jgi:hypothetical protein